VTPAQNVFNYRVCFFVLDLDELPALDRGLHVDDRRVDDVHGEERKERERLATTVLERGCHFLADELLPLRGFDLGDEPVTDGEENRHGDQHRYRFDQRAARWHGTEQRLEHYRGRETREHPEHYSDPHRAEPLAVTGLDQERHDCSEHQDRFEAFAQDDEE